jgi:protein O-GlcNAc transferase
MGLFDRLLNGVTTRVVDFAAEARGHFDLGNLLLDQGQAQQAIVEYKQALRLKPDAASAHFNMGNAYLVLHEYQVADQCYKQAIALKPDFTDALVALGNVQVSLEDFGKAIEYYRAALKQNPEYAQVHQNLGDALRSQKCFEEARNAYAEALNLDASQIELLYKLGAVEHDLFLSGQDDLELLTAAEAHYLEFLTKRPNSVDAHLGLAKALYDHDRYEHAIAEFRNAIACAPQNTENLLTLGLVLQCHEDLDEAAKCYLRAIEVDPALAAAHNNLGAIAKKLGDSNLAISHFKRAIAEDPEYAQAHFNLGLAYKKASRYEDAEQCFLKAIQLKPDFAEAYIDYGMLLQHFGKPNVAEEKYRKALELDPKLSATYVNLGVVLCHTGRFSEADALFEKGSLIHPNDTGLLINWSNAQKDMGNVKLAIALLKKAIAIDPTLLGAYSNLLFNQHYLPNWDDGQMLQDARSFGIQAEMQARPFQTWANEKNLDRAIRIGLVSGDLRNHPVGYFLEGVLASISANTSANVDVYAFPTRACSDAVSEKLRSYCKGWHSAIELSDSEFCDVVRQNHIDILVDLSGHTGYSRLGMFAWRPAPLQVSWLGYFATTGLSAIDYLIADPWTLPKSEECNFVEKIWRLPESRLCFTPPKENIDVNALPAIKNGYVTFSCFNNLAKVGDRVIQAWARILSGTPGSRLLVKSQLKRDQEKTKEVFARFAANGISADQLTIEDYESRQNYFYAHHRVDIALDPFPYPGGTTTAESLWMGVPVLTLAGTHFLERQGVGLLANVGLKDWIADDEEDYIAKGLRLAADIENLVQLRSALRQKALSSPIFDGQRFANHFVEAMRQMWVEYCVKDVLNNLPPNEVAVG